MHGKRACEHVDRGACSISDDKKYGNVLDYAYRIDSLVVYKHSVLSSAADLATGGDATFNTRGSRARTQFVDAAGHMLIE